MSETVRIGLGERSYDVIVGAGLLASVGGRVRELFPGSGRVFVVHDNNLPKETVALVRDSLASEGFAVAGDGVNALESNKTVATVDRLLHGVAETRHERTDPVVALGGGIVGDVAGFVAASFKRGVPVVQCPTTLLAMVDASVGGKTGVNLGTRSGLKKNLVGAFWQPSLVLADVETLRSLPTRELSAGLGECLKHGLICASPSGPGEASPGTLFEETKEHCVRIRMGELDRAVRLIAENVRVKAAFVAGDERETAPSAAGGRALLNLGHTFAHAIETIPHLSPDGDPEHAPLLHGE
ncbi:MAG: 3-dehydroquinate synthase family protein, partial [Planctomycetota bacterium]